MEPFDWSEKYRPKKISECILPRNLKASLTSFVEHGLTNTLFHGGPGVGKTTTALALADELGMEALLIKASTERGIGTIRNMGSFASTMSDNGNVKAVIIDEADGLTPDAQDAIRNATQTYSGNCVFIMTANFPGKLTAPVRSRFTPEFQFRFPAEEAVEIKTEAHKRFSAILKAEGYEFTPEALGALVNRFYPDFRRSVLTLQNLVQTHGKLDAGAVAGFSSNIPIKKLMAALKARKIEEIRKWAADNTGSDIQAVVRTLYDGIQKYAVEESLPIAIISLGECLKYAPNVADQEILLASTLMQMMQEVKWK